MLKRLLGIWPATALLLLLVTQSLLAKVEVFPGDKPLADYKTYRWARSRIFTAKQGFSEDDPIVIPAIRKSVNEQLLKAGMMQVTENADIDLYSFASGQSVPNMDFMIFGMAPTVNSMAAYSPGYRTVTMGRYNKEGTLYLNMVDGKTNKPVWLGIVTKSIDKPENLEKDVNKAVAELFKKFKR